MGDFLGESQCVTHHYACECREKMLADEIKRWKTEALAARDYYETTVPWNDTPKSCEALNKYKTARAANKEERFIFGGLWTKEE